MYVVKGIGIRITGTPGMEKYIPALLHETANREAQREEISDIVVSLLMYLITTKKKEKVY